MLPILVILAAIPVVVICTYIYMKDKNREPWKLLAKLFAMGIASCFLVLFISNILFKIIPFMDKDTSAMNFFEVMAYSFIGVALVEEFCKWLMTYKGAYRNRSYDELYDGIVYAVYVSLGFAFLENILYVVGNWSVTIGISRALLAVPGHACDAIFMGYYLSLAKVYSYQGQKDLERKNLILSVVVPTILHGIYDFCLFAEVEILLVFFIIFVIFIYIASFKKIKKLAGPSKNANQNNTVNIPQNQPNHNNQTINNYPQQNNYQQQYPAYSNVNNQQQYPAYNNMNNQQQYPAYNNMNSQPQYQGYNNMNNQNNFNQQNHFCPNCGSQVVGSYCSNCGTRQN